MTESEPIKVIFDTDVGNDIDDVLALQMLFNYEENGIIDILCVRSNRQKNEVFNIMWIIMQIKAL